MKIIKIIRRVIGYPICFISAIIWIIGLLIAGDGDAWFDMERKY